jgi:hypothetical protein
MEGLPTPCPSPITARMSKYFLAAAIALALLGPAEAQSSFRTFYNANGGYAGSSATTGKFTNYYDRNGQFVGSSVRQGIGKRR